MNYMDFQLQLTIFYTLKGNSKAVVTAGNMYQKTIKGTKVKS